MGKPYAIPAKAIKVNFMKKVTEIMEIEGHCVPYFGGSKDDTQAAHMANRERLLTEGVVSREDYDAAVAKMAK